MLPAGSAAPYARRMRFSLDDPSLPVILIAVLALLATVLPLHAVLGIYRGVERRRPRDVSDRETPPSTVLHTTVAALAVLGFRRLGEYEVTLPGGPVAILRRNGRSTAGAATRAPVAWVFVDIQETTVAEVVVVGGDDPPEALVGLTTTMRDGAVVETMYPRGERIEDPDFHSGHVRTSLAAAYDDHRLHAGRFTPRHGTPRRVSTMRDLLREDELYRRRFAKRKLRGPLIRRHLAPALLVSAMSLAGIAAALHRL
jgi:hypothetical protein